jgi:pimeloyl-ACP methyl ester carboxylesterase
MRCEGINVFLCDGEVAFQTVFQFHLHVIPRYTGHGWTIIPESAGRERSLLDSDAQAIKHAIVAELRRGEPWFPEAFAAFERIWCGDQKDSDWDAIAPFWHGRWDPAQVGLALPDDQKNEDAAEVYYDDGAINPGAVRAAIGSLPARVLILTGEYDVGLPPGCAAEFASLFLHAELAVQPGGGHFAWLDDPGWVADTLARFLSP